MKAGAAADPLGDGAPTSSAAPALGAEVGAAVALLTRLPVRVVDPGRTGSAAFALVGAGLGAAAAVPAVLLVGVAPMLGSVLAIATIEIATGALHLDGLADTADALAAPNAARAEAARIDPRVGSAGAGAIVLVVAAAVGALVAIPGPSLAGALLVAGAASRAVPPIAAPWVRRRPGARRATPRGDDPPGASSPSGFGAWFGAGSGAGGAAVALATCLVAVAVAAATAAWASAGSLGWAPAIVAAPAVAAATGLGVGLLVLTGLARRFGALAGDHFGAATEIAFVAALAAQAVVLGMGRP